MASPVHGAGTRSGGPGDSPSRARSRPDRRPARLVAAGGALAAISMVITGLVRVPGAQDATVQPGPESRATSPKVRVERPVRYVRLKRGEQAPPGAKVIREAAPTPRVVVRSVAAPSGRAARPLVARTRQSGA